VAQSSKQAPFTSEIVDSIPAMDSCEKRGLVGGDYRVEIYIHLFFNEDTNFTCSGLQRGPRTSKHILKIIKLQMKITRQNKQVITIQFFRGGS
jgi:hypothetical protein